MAGATIQAPQTARGSVAYGALAPAAQRISARAVSPGSGAVARGSASFALFRGQVIGAKVDAKADLPIVTLDCEDYNRIPPLVAVGAPNGNVFIIEADGTRVAIDAGALNSSVQITLMPTYWPLVGVGGLTLDLNSGFIAPDVPGLPIIDRTTAMTDLAAFLNELAARVSGSTHWWIDPDMVFWWYDLIDSDPIPAPYELDNDAPDTSGRIMANMSLSWDFAPVRTSVYVRGGTPAPFGSGWAAETAGGLTGYVDAPGVLDTADRDAVGAWHRHHEFRAMLTATAHIRPEYNGWRVGQTVTATDSVLGRVAGHDLDHRTGIIQRVSGKLIAPAGASVGDRLLVEINGVPITRRIDWRSFSFEQTFGSPGKATLVFSLVDAGDLEIGELSDVLVVSESAPIEYDIEFGDVPAGSLAIELAKEDKPAGPPAYVFEVSTPAYPNLLTLPVGSSTQVVAQAADKSGVGYPLDNLPVEWFILQWTDAGETAPATAYSLAGAQGSDGGWGGDPTDMAGKAFQTVTRDSGDAVDHLSIRATALPVT